MNPVQLDIQQLRIKHILFKSKLRSVLYGGNYDDSFFSEKGPVEQWFATVGRQKYNGIVQIRELYRLHQELNMQARALISLYQINKIDEAHDGLRSIDQLSGRFLSLLEQVEQLTV